ncbi:UDP-N-acetylmuramate--L-alanine ligase [Chitinophaga costaii]|uniref:UDP-N-acetylmuramate--L-alanine ligase n=1 Tax=Chitinophaga costaii TaxID=1335309 RepID=A0A1C4BTM7_9BACT|nr:UDP-N-acetylmuramate--L-alanine ligase [Chitinophaga costaii]PUZ27475.1 UDP-N-acetylmuramate--L-alanine ligase [Chitinophaga costaii]SCC10245.1 UDP-N-acetylmuramate--L-alanine ligase [Chitinophaga costaii]
MIAIKNIQRVYFIGIGGIGMSAIARYFNENGASVGGYDRTETSLTQQLVTEGMHIHYTDDVQALDREANVVVYTPAIPAGHAELNWYRDHGYTVVKRSDILQAITNEMYAITIAGTHGKTTISTMTAHILRHSGYGCNAFLGGISVNYNRNFWSSDRKVAVIEADEYDRSFLKLNPDIAVLTAMDPDHLDIYGTPEAMEEAFIQYTKNIKPNGTLLAKYGLKRHTDLATPNKITYSLTNNQANIYAVNIRPEAGGYTFDVIEQSWTITDVRLNIGGLHNVENALVAISVAYILGIDTALIKAAVADFKGIRRRFEYVVRKENKIYIDDYAHHPEELRALITSAKALFPGKKCTVVFQPHLFSRTKDLADGFAEVLSLADEVVLLPIYPARELPMEGVTSALIARKMTHTQVQVLEKAALLEWLPAHLSPLLITAGAGDIDLLKEKIKAIVEA